MQHLKNISTDKKQVFSLAERHIFYLCIDNNSCLKGQQIKEVQGI
ncbi:hypothetical protein HMPREF9140_01107 [Prevotella micans F0438]|uniref:Uncharacterized protein n=1 Tax=Prevotella micans F0438 TaxID=883158 RepID=H1Q2G9_9BACT|nr:hypothetical protein HMPREF9140_01107 [Prevotella micans F0438]